MERFPRKITPCPINEAFFEVRFNTDLPIDAVFGLIYQAVEKDFPNSKLISLPILQLPSVVRETEKNFMFLPYHRLEQGNISISIGPKVIIFSNQSPYIGWETWKKRISDILKTLVETKICTKFYFTGLRYVNYFESDLFCITDFNIEIGKTSLKFQPTTLRTEIEQEGQKIIVNLASNVNVLLNEANLKGSLIDITVVSNFDYSNNNFGEKIEELLEISHKNEKQFFFNLLKPEFLNTLNPEYEYGGGE